MEAFVEARLAGVWDLCRVHCVKRLDVFGSASTGAFDPHRSDVDLLVEFDDWRAASSFDRYFDFKDAMEGLFGRPVDLVLVGAIGNPFLRLSIQRTRQLLYAA